MATNLVVLTGHLGGDPEIKTFENGNKVASFSLATTDKGFTTRDGKEIPESTQWHNITAFKHNAKFCEYFHKGDKIQVVGKLVYDKWEDKDGIKRISAKVRVESIEGMNSIGSNTQQAPPHEINDAPPEVDENGLPF